jgi:S1-C subfamily serine protease
MAVLQDVSDGLVAAVAAIGPSVLEVRGRRRPASGVAIAPDRVITAAHVLHRDDDLAVVDAAGELRPAVLVGRDPATDLALLSVPGTSLPPVVWADPGSVRVGALVLPVARLHGSVRVRLGVVSGVSGAWKTALGAEVDRWIDVDADLPAGFSGGPLVDAAGRALGIDTRALTPRGAVLTPAVVARVAERLATCGPVPPGYLGVGFYPASAGDEEQLVVVSIEPGGPGERAGIAVGDVLHRFDGIPVDGVRHLLGLLAARGAGAEVGLQMARGGEPREVRLSLAARPGRLACR